MVSVESQQRIEETSQGLTLPGVSRELMGLADVARELGMTDQAIKNWHARGKLPPEDYTHGANQRPLWRRSTLERAGVLERASSERTRAPERSDGS